MRRAMAQAEVGDDVYGKTLPSTVCRRWRQKNSEKRPGLFVVSGTMGNLTAILTHCQRGDEVILGNKSHTFLFEAGGMSALGGVHPCQLPNQPDGTLELADIQSAIRETLTITDRFPGSSYSENTHNRCGGVALALTTQAQLAYRARRTRLQVDLDGVAAVRCGRRQGNQREKPGRTGGFC